MELEKLREAVLGGNGRNLDDLPHMDGELIIFLINRFLKIFSFQSLYILQNLSL